MAIVMVGTRGIGAGLIIDGQVYHGVGGGAGEIGHTPVTGNGRQCVCGRRGCLEAVATGWALVQRAREMADRFPDSLLNTLAGDSITFDELRRITAQSDPAATTLARETGHYLGLAVATLIGTMNPQRVVIGGSVSELGEPFFQSLKCTVEAHTLALIAQETEILPASLGADVNLLGAVAQVLQGELGVV
jgi:glucokinase